MKNCLLGPYIIATTNPSQYARASKAAELQHHRSDAWVSNLSQGVADICPALTESKDLKCNFSLLFGTFFWLLGMLR